MKNTSSPEDDTVFANILYNLKVFKCVEDIRHLTLFRDFSGQPCWEADYDTSYPSIDNIDPELIFLTGFRPHVDTISFESDVVIGSEVFATGTTNDTDILVTLESAESSAKFPLWDISGFTPTPANPLEKRLPSDIKVTIFLASTSQAIALEYKATIDPEKVASGIDHQIDDVIEKLFDALEDDEQLHCEIHESDCLNYQAVIASSITADPETGDMRRTFLTQQVRSRPISTTN